MPVVFVYRELSEPSESLVKWLEERDQLFVVADPKGIEHMYIDNGTPRDVDISEEIVGGLEEGRPFPGCTKGFALFSEDGEYIASFRDLERAEEAAKSAKLVIKTEYQDVLEDDE
jgi:hypothetical protein